MSSAEMRFVVPFSCK